MFKIHARTYYKVSGLIRFFCNSSKRFFHDVATIKLQVYNFGVESFTDG